jgi:hypothetical protein
VPRVRADRPVAAVSRSFAFCLLAQGKHTMARAEECADFFRGFEVFLKVFAAQKKRGKPGFFRSFLFTLRERSRMMRMSVRKKNLISWALYPGKSEKFKGEIWQS